MMNKIAIIVLADIQTLESLGRVVNAMMAVKEFKEAKDDVKFIFDGAATQWIGELSHSSHQYHSLFNAIKDNITGACSYCANAFQVTDKVKASHVHLVAEFEGHPSFRKLIIEGYQILIF